MKNVALIAALLLFVLNTQAQLSIIQPSLSNPTEQVIYTKVANHFAVEGKGVIEKVTASAGVIENQTENSFDVLIDKALNTKLLLTVTLKSTETEEQEQKIYRLKVRGLPNFPVLVNGVASGGNLSKKELGKMRVSYFTQQFDFGYEPNMESMELRFEGADGAQGKVVKIINGDFTNNAAFKKAVAKAEVGGRLLVRNIVTVINGTKLDGVSLQFNIMR